MLLHESHEAGQTFELRDCIGIDDRQIVARRRGKRDSLILGVGTRVGLLDQHAVGIVGADQFGGAIAGAVRDHDDRQRIAHPLLAKARDRVGQIVGLTGRSECCHDTRGRTYGHGTNGALALWRFYEDLVPDRDEAIGGSRPRQLGHTNETCCATTLPHALVVEQRR